MSATTITAVSVASSAKPRRLHLARCIHALGEGPLFYRIREMSSSPWLAMFEAYAALDGDFIRASTAPAAADDMPRQIGISRWTREAHRLRGAHGAGRTAIARGAQSEIIEAAPRTALRQSMTPCLSIARRADFPITKTTSAAALSI